MSTKGILKAGNKIQTNLNGASNYDLKVGGVSVSSATSSMTLGPYDNDQFYELTVNSGAVSVSCYDALINSAIPSVDLANLGSAQSAGVGAYRDITDAVKLAISTPAGWHTFPSITPYPRTSAGINAAVAACLAVTSHAVIAFDEADYIIDSDITISPNVSYVGHKPKLVFTGDVPDADFSCSGGTRFIQSAGVTGFKHNNVDKESEEVNIAENACSGVKMYGITFVGGLRAVDAGAKNAMGMVFSEFDELYAFDQTADYAFRFTNPQHCDFGRVYSSSQLTSGGGFYCGSKLSVTLLPGNCTFSKEIYTYSKNILNRSITFECNHSSGAVLNQIKVTGRLQGNRYGLATPTSISMAMTSGSANIVVADATQYRYMQVGMPVAFTTAANAFGANIVYFVLTRNDATNTITLGEAHYSTTPVSATATATATAYCSGWPSVEIKASNGGAVANSDFGQLDLEAYGNVCALYVAKTRNVVACVSEIMTSYSNTALARRDAQIGLTYAGTTTLTEDLSVLFGTCSTTNLAGGPFPYSGGSFTLDSSHNGMVYRYTGTAAITITIPLSLPKGFKFDIENDSTGSVTFTAASGGAIRSVSSYLKVSVQYGVGRLRNIANKVYHLGGDLSA